MTKTPCPAGCGKKFISEEHAKRHADEAHLEWRVPKQKGWVTPYGFMDFAEPISYEEACRVAKKSQEGLAARLWEGEEA